MFEHCPVPIIDQVSVNITTVAVGQHAVVAATAPAPAGHGEVVAVEPAAVPEVVALPRALLSVPHTPRLHHSQGSEGGVGSVLLVAAESVHNDHLVIVHEPRTISTFSAVSGSLNNIPVSCTNIRSATTVSDESNLPS